MKKFFILFVFFLLSLHALTTLAEEARLVEKQTVMIADCSSEAAEKSLLDDLTNTVEETILKQGKFLLVNRKDQKKLFEEMKFQMSGLSDQTKNLVKLGAALNAQKMVVCELTKAGNIYKISLKLTDIGTMVNEEIASEDYDGKKKNLPKIIPIVVLKLLKLEVPKSLLTEKILLQKADEKDKESESGYEGILKLAGDPKILLLTEEYSEEKKSSTSYFESLIAENFLKRKLQLATTPAKKIRSKLAFENITDPKILKEINADILIYGKVETKKVSDNFMDLGMPAYNVSGNFQGIRLKSKEILFKFAVEERQMGTDSEAAKKRCTKKLLPQILSKIYENLR